MVIAGYLLAICMGMGLGLIGAGGSIMTLPILVYCMKIPPVTATGYSLLFVGSTALMGGIRYYWNQNVNLKAAAFFAAPSLVSVYSTRRWIVPAIPDPVISLESIVITKDHFIMLLFALLMLLAATLMIFSSKLLPSEPKKQRQFHPFTMMCGGAVVGLFTAMIGAGGGFLIIPTLILLAGLEMRVAVGSSLCIIALNSLTGFVGSLQSGMEIEYPLIVLFLSCTSLGLFLGAILSSRVSEDKLKKGFGWFTLFVGASILISEL